MDFALRTLVLDFSQNNCERWILVRPSVDRKGTIFRLSKWFLWSYIDLLGLLTCRYIQVFVKFAQKTTQPLHIHWRIYKKSPFTRQAQKWTGTEIRSQVTSVGFIVESVALEETHIQVLWLSPTVLFHHCSTFTINSSIRTVALQLTEPLTEMKSRNISWG